VSQSWDLGLSGAVTLVTGAAGGIGSAACREFLNVGATVIGIDVSADGLKALKEGLGTDAKFEFHCVDLSDADAVFSLISRIEKDHGRIDVVFNNASIEGAVSSIVDYPVEVFDSVIAINVRSIFLMMKAVLPGMISRKSGSIINMGSTASFRGPGMLGAYSASKHAVIGLTRTAAGEAAPHGVRVNALCPGPTATRMMSSIEEMVNPSAPSAAHAAWTSAIPRGQYGQPQELARVAVLLASPLLSNVVGASWLADGGLTAV
jgi:NAD(P)-dependent dehydrogenase (short-subunit alcohol dehydrogenase family)